MSRSPLNDREYAQRYVRTTLRAWAAENQAEDALARAGLDDLVAAVLADWDTRMGGPGRDKRKELDRAVSAAVARRLLANPDAPDQPRPRVYPPGVNSTARVDEAVARSWRTRLGL